MAAPTLHCCLDTSAAHVCLEPHIAHDDTMHCAWSRREVLQHDENETGNLLLRLKVPQHLTGLSALAWKGTITALSGLGDDFVGW